MPDLIRHPLFAWYWAPGQARGDVLEFRGDGYWCRRDGERISLWGDVRRPVPAHGMAYRALSLLLVVGYFAPAPPRLAGSADKAEAARQ
ncbi:MAG: hypothetical protein SH820_08435 [Xanthomonadales bacterium]|nr:hypothetical protein [Xanthomonadales bacterium]